MLKVTVELVPSGYSPLRRTIGSMTISNISDLAPVSDYQVDVLEAANPLTGSPARNGDCVVVGHDRNQTVWKLLERACAEVAEADFFEF